MSQSGYTPIQIYRTTTAAATPSAVNLVAGELAINLTDEKLYFKNTAGTVKLLASSAGALGTVTSVDVSGSTTGLTFTGGPITSSGTITLGGTLGVANGGTGATSLTSGYLVKGNGTSAVSASVVYDDGTNVGIGTASPSYKLAVNDGDASVTKNDASAASPIIYLRKGRGTPSVPANISSGDNLGAMWFSGYSGSANNNGYGYGAYIQGQADGAINATTVPGRLVFATTTSGSSTPAERMRLDSSGSLLIGKTSVSGLGEILGVNRASDGTTAMIGRSGGTYNPYARFIATDASALTTLDANSSAGSPQLAFSTNSSERMRIDSSGNVGIGTSSPASKLDVNGTIQVGYTASGQNLIAYNGDATNYQRISIGMSGTNAVFNATRSSGTVPNILFQIDSSEKMRIDSSGNVGIGTSSPNSKLEVFGGNVRSALAGASAATLRGFVMASDSTEFASLKAEASSGETRLTSGFAAFGGFSTFYTNGSERMRIDSSGNVGIGTSSPGTGTILDVQSTTKGVRFPNMTTTQKNAITPSAGTVVFDTTLSKLCVYTGAAWQTITSA